MDVHISNSRPNKVITVAQPVHHDTIRPLRPSSHGAISQICESDPREAGEMTKRHCLSKEMRRVKTVVKAREAGFIECVSWYIVQRQT